MTSETVARSSSMDEERIRIEANKGKQTEPQKHGNPVCYWFKIELLIFLSLISII